MSLKEKLHPKQFSAMSGKMAAIVGYVVGEQFTDPELAEIAITSDGFVLGRRSDDCGLNEWIGSVSDLECNIASLLEAAGLTKQEKAEWQRCYSARIMDWRSNGRQISH